jgi:uncharacterized protein (DUF433 family)
MVHKDYLEQRNGAFYITGTRVSLDSVIHHFREGASPETILQKFPSLQKLENVYGAITSYLANQAAFDEYLAQQEQRWEEFRKRADPFPEQFLERLEGMRQEHLHSVK